MRLLLFEMRSKRKISLRELEKLTGISKSTLSRYEALGNEKADIKNLETIARVFKCRIEDLYDSDCK